MEVYYLSLKMTSKKLNFGTILLEMHVHIMSNEEIDDFKAYLVYRCFVIQ